MIEKHSTDIIGLKYRPSFVSDELNNDDYCVPYNKYIRDLDLKRFEFYEGGPTGLIFTPANTLVLESLCKKIKNSGNQRLNVLEIGAARDTPSSTTTLIEYADTYMAVDLRNLSSLCSNPKVKTIETSSFNQSEIRAFVGSTPIDLLFIDGDHSINTVLNDWLYQDLVVEGGYIVFHDTNHHTGPHTIFEAINEWDYTKQRFCLEDFGLAIVKKNHKNQIEIV